MNNAIEVQILAIDELIEEHMTLLICGNVVECFVNYCADIVTVGETHLVEITIDYSDHHQIEESPETDALLEKIGTDFDYYVHGTLEVEAFKSFIELSDDVIHFDHPELVGKFVKIKVDRINVDFL